jgi:hypothetical protein
MSTTTNLARSASTATWRMRGVLTVAPQSVHVEGAESVFATLDNPAYGMDITAVSRVRDAKQAAPPRGELH